MCLPLGSTIAHINFRVRHILAFSEGLLPSCSRGKKVWYKSLRLASVSSSGLNMQSCRLQNKGEAQNENARRTRFFECRGAGIWRWPPWCAHHPPATSFAFNQCLRYSGGTSKARRTFLRRSCASSPTWTGVAVTRSPARPCAQARLRALAMCRAKKAAWLNRRCHRRRDAVAQARSRPSPPECCVPLPAIIRAMARPASCWS